jgi:hypothetical protein
MQAVQNADGTFVVDGKAFQSINALERAFGFPKNSLRGRLKQGWSLQEALTMPIDTERSIQIRETVEQAKAKSGARRPRSNTASTLSTPEAPICDLIRTHLADKRPRDIMEQRRWWAILGHYYAALRNASFTTETGNTRPGFYEWIQARGLADFSSDTVKAAIDVAHRWDELRTTPVWRTGRTHPTDLIRSDLH